MLKKLKGLLFKEEGQALSEYGLIIALVAVIVIAATVLFNGAISDLFGDITGILTDQTP